MITSNHILSTRPTPLRAKLHPMSANANPTPARQDPAPAAGGQAAGEDSCLRGVGAGTAAQGGLGALLEFLRSEGSGEPVEDHKYAEKLLLEAIGNKEVTEAWNNCEQTWWYA